MSPSKPRHATDAPAELATPRRPGQPLASDSPNLRPSPDSDHPTGPHPPYEPRAEGVEAAKIRDSGGRPDPASADPALMWKDEKAGRSAPVAEAKDRPEGVALSPRKHPI